MWVIAGPSSGETCVRSVDAGSPAVTPEADLVAALAAAFETTCPVWRIELTGTFPLTDTLVWDEPVPLHLVGPEGLTARLEATGPGHRLLTLGLDAGGEAMTLERLVLAGGDLSKASGATEDTGGAVDAEVLYLIDVELNGNRAVVGGAVSTFDLTATRVSFVDNSADLDDGEGGAIRAYGTVALTNVTFRGNTAKSGGALHHSVPLNGSASLVATNVTFLGNESDDASGGAHLHLVGNAAELAVTMRGVLLGAVGGDSNGPSCAGSRFTATPAITSEASLAAEAGCGVTVDVVVATLAYDTVPFLSATTDLLLPSGSWIGLDAYACVPANGWPTTDQRGLARPQGAAGLCDIGAVERVYVAPPSPPPPPAPDPDSEPVVATEGPVPTSVPAGGGGCADGCPPIASDGSD